MTVEKIVCLFFDEEEEYFFQKPHSRYLSHIPLHFVSSINKLKNFIDEKSFIVLSVRFADQNISEVKQLLNDYSQFVFNFFHYDSINPLPLNIHDLLSDYPNNTTKPESGYFLMQQLKKRLE